MEIIKGLIMIVGIVGLIIVGCMMFIKSDGVKQANTKTYKETMTSLQETNKMLDETLEELKNYNEPLEKISNAIDTFNRKFLGGK